MPTRRQLIQALPAAGAAFALGCHWLSGEGQARAQDATLSALCKAISIPGKAPSKFTQEVLKKAKATLPFGDKRDFEEQKKGLIAPMKDLKIKADAGHVAWDMERFQFLDTQDEFDSIHPSLFRQSVLNNRPGTKVRGADIAQAHPYEAVPRQTIAE